MKKYYKIVFRDCFDRMTSYASDIRGRIYYKQNRFVNAPNSTGLFIFDSLDNALSFSRYDGVSFEIWECEVKNPRKVKTIALAISNEINKFWKFKKSKKKRIDCMTKLAPIGTMVCDAVKLTKYITNCERS